jgi:hypothetical protein
MPEEITRPAIHMAVIGVMEDISNVPKTGQMTNRKGELQYRFLKSADVLTAIGTAFRKHAVMVQSKDCRITHAEHSVSGQAGSTLWVSAWVEITYVFTSLVDGSVLEFASAGEGRDSSDKATSKAMTVALKWALTQAFAIATNDTDPEAERPMVVQDPQYAPAPPPANETDAQRAAREAYESRRRSQETPAATEHRAQAAQSQPAPADPLGAATEALTEGLGARPVDKTKPISETFQRELDATDNIRTAGAELRAAERGERGELVPANANQAERCRRAIAAGTAASTRDAINRIINQAAVEGLLPLTLDGVVVGMALDTARNTHQAVTP